MDEIRIPNHATYSPVNLMELGVAAPLLSRLLLGATLPGRLLQVASFGLYAASALADWAERAGVRRIDFEAEYGAGVRRLDAMPSASRETEIGALVERLNDGYTAARLPRAELAVLMDRHLTEYIASVTGQRVVTSTEVRRYSMIGLLMPFAIGACDPLSGEIVLLRDTGVLEPHVLAHELTHRKGYFKELEAQALAYLALTSSGEPLLVQSALAERLLRQLTVLSGDDVPALHARLDASGLREELAPDLLALRPLTKPMEHSVASALKAFYDLRMRLTGQNGISDYDEGFTRFLYTFERNAAARRQPPAAGVVWSPATSHA